LENINNNREILLNDINECHQNSNFKYSDMPRLVAVSKKQEDYKIDLAIKSGQKNIWRK
jgi:uncharacterized pyridoxal phosphate-containing UPF0001 family protein